ncbi:MAG: bifunctional 5,10-methylenetetrahydrofolate dehydrogenase/5,10-methenyltetrahydrofolate cyclohydrolase [Planctomycetes bacterium]|nr:bifunctional 5,10-methylenetetrahydrofolate dehydrogenase/5,10-methenyltetrahydrofolate cyclohydrolase [Planctomycetota bacterium]
MRRGGGFAIVRRATNPRRPPVPAQILDGRRIAQQMRRKLRAARDALGPRPIRLVSVEVGQNPAAAVYVRNQQRGATEVGIEMEARNLPLQSTETQLLAMIRDLNHHPEVSGVIVQRPLPPGIDPRVVQSAIDPHKDVEGMHPANMGAILYREPTMPPCTAAAAQELALATGMDLRGAETVVVGHSEIVGKPIAVLLLHRLSTVTVCHVGTRRLVDHTRRADILVVAVGKAGLVHGDMVKPGACVIDVGINQGPDGKIVGDVDFASASAVAGWITPVPGGVGPVTVAMLLRNTLRAAGAAI